VLLALFFKRIRMDYNVWRIFHKVAILIVALGFVHALVLGPDLDNGFLRAYWFAMFAVVAFVFLWRNLYVPIWSRARYRVISVDKESHDTWTLAFAPEGGTKALVHHPGQFWFLKLIRPGRPSELHPFTISSSPTTEPPLTSTIKASGNFTRTIGETRAGDKARIEGPFGRFSLVNYPAHAFLFIAGGVGITPIMSMLRYLRDAADTRPVGLVYACKARKDMLFRDELADMPNNVHVTPILSSPEADWDRYEGYVNTELLQQEVDGLISQADIFLCGPPVMMEKVIQSLKELGVAKNRIHYERFTI
jgi:3-phenylpropionate/trans-cinnamate dioxygenase ferredoxin reductase subunit